ncbi:MAG: 30S ribosome-binding factor RbfA [Elusimicrobia bacterium]|nr:30S ribosome-binding factor RbfA [Elusimicrobiota bacterium]
MFARSERLKELFKIEIIQALRGVKDPGVSGLMTVTDLALSPDMKTATVYYSVLGSARQRAGTAGALERAAPYLRQVLRKRLSLKFIPHFVFLYDDTPRKASRIDQLLMRIEGEQEGG